MEEEGAAVPAEAPSLDYCSRFFKRVIKCNTTPLTAEGQKMKKRCITDL